MIEELLPETTIELVVLGGSVRRNYRSLVGVLAEDALRQLSCDIAFLGASGIGRGSVRDGHDDGRGADQARDDRRRQAQVVLLADAAKFAMHGSVRVCSAADLDIVVTDAPPAEPRVARLADGRRRGGARMKIAILGGGGFRVPMVYGALLARARAARARGGRRCTTSTRRGSRRSRRCSKGSSASAASSCRSGRRCTLDEALEGADFVFCAIRVGQLEGRVVDEQVPLDEGVVGQETTGPGGICFALRTVPVMRELAERSPAARRSAWFVNFTNPAGPRHRGDPGRARRPRRRHLRLAAGLFRRVAGALERDPDELWFDYFGLNHLGWLRGVHDGDARPAPGPARRRRAARVVRGGPAVRRRVAARRSG